MRQQMEEHRANPVCSSCHSKMDPVGFGFENFDAIGQWRTKDGKFAIDPSGTLPDGRSFKGAEDLRALLAKDAPKFAECVTDKLLTYALGRGLERYDRRTVKDIASRIAKDDYRFSSLVLEIVNSLPFQMAHTGSKEDMINTGKHLHRRTFLRGLGAAIALPVLDAMPPAFASTPKTPIRLAFTYIPNGVTMKDWKPATTGAGFDDHANPEATRALPRRSAVLSGLDHHNAESLGDGAGMVSAAIA